MLPELDAEGNLPPGIHAALLAEVVERFGAGGDARAGFGRLLTDVVNAAKQYPTIKRVLVWGSFVTTKAEPRDLDYSVVVSADHRNSLVVMEHRRFLVPPDARVYYGIDRGYFVIPDYPLEHYLSRLEFMLERRDGIARGIVEISLRGEDCYR